MGPDWEEEDIPADGAGELSECWVNKATAAVCFSGAAKSPGAGAGLDATAVGALPIAADSEDIYSASPGVRHDAGQGQ